MTPEASTNPLCRTNPAAVDDWRALGDLVHLATERLAAPAEGIHHAIADRWFGIAGRSDSTARSAYRGLTNGIYDSVRVAGAAARTGLSVGAATIGDHRSVRPLWNSRLGAGIQAATNALWGDEFAHRESPMHTALGIRNTEGESVTTDAESLGATFVEPKRRLAVMLHGLGHTERCWESDLDGAEGGNSTIHGTLEEDSFTPVFVRYNSGMRVSENGAALANLLEELLANWPIAVDEVALVGHSMGGLIARSALHKGAAQNHMWPKSTQHVVAIASPHHGSTIEQGVHLASRVLSTVAEGRPLSEFINKRSDGIKDMRFGTIHDGDLSETRGSAAHRAHASAVKGVDHHLVAGVITQDVSHPLGRLLGDLVVRARSATGIGAGSGFSATNTRVFGGLHHPGLLQDPSVQSQIREWLTPEPHAVTDVPA